MPISSGIKWEDKSHRTLGQPRTVNAIMVRVGGVDLIVHRYRDYPGKWCYSFGQISGPTPLDSDDLENAKAEAVEVVKGIIYGIERDLEKVEVKK